MIEVADLSFDASRASWQDFVSALGEIRMASEHGSVIARIRPPARCLGAARRVIRDMGLADCVELVEHRPVAGHVPDRFPDRRRGGRTPLAHALLTRLGLSPRASRS